MKSGSFETDRPQKFCSAQIGRPAEVTEIKDGIVVELRIQEDCRARKRGQRKVCRSHELRLHKVGCPAKPGFSKKSPFAEFAVSEGRIMRENRTLETDR